jgi:hypothetical protein
MESLSTIDLVVDKIFEVASADAQDIQDTEFTQHFQFSFSTNYTSHKYGKVYCAWDPYLNSCKMTSSLGRKPFPLNVLLR